MQTAILHTIRHHAQVQGSLRFTALEMAYRFNTSNICRIAYSYLAKRTGYHVRTIMRHVAKLVELGLIEKTVTRLRYNRCAINLYTYCGPKEEVPKGASSDRGVPALNPREKTSSRAREKPRSPEELWWYDAYAATHGLGYGGVRSP